MISTTIREIIKNEIDDTGHYLYVYRDGDVIFYVGKSYHPISRFWQHMGLGGWHGMMKTRLGNLIEENLLESLDWNIDLYSLKDCIPLLLQKSPAILQHPDFQPALLSPVCIDIIIEHIEEVLIDHYHPHLNMINKRQRRPLPDAYSRLRITNAGVRLEGQEGSGIEEPFNPYFIAEDGVYKRIRHAPTLFMRSTEHSEIANSGVKLG